MYGGMIVTYYVRPPLNIPQILVTEISHVNKPNCFVDEQRFGPDKMWHYEHIFTKRKDGGAMMQDRVSYVIPFGVFGRIINWLLIEKK